MKARETRAAAREAMTGKWGRFVGMNILVGLVSTLFVMIAMIPMLGSIGTIITDAASGIEPTETQIMGMLGSVGGSYLLLILAMILTVPLEYAFIENVMKLKRDNDTKATMFLGRIFPSFGRAWKVTLWMLVKILIAYLILVGALIAGGIVVGIVSAIGVDVLTNIFGFLYAVLIIGMEVFMVAKVLSLVLSNYIAIDNPDMTAKESVNKSVELMNGYRWKYICLGLSFIGWAILCCFTLGIGYLFLTPYMLVADVCFYEKVLEEKGEKKVEPEPEPQKEPEVVAENI